MSTSARKRKQALMFLKENRGAVKKYKSKPVQGQFTHARKPLTKRKFTSKAKSFSNYTLYNRGRSIMPSIYVTRLPYVDTKTLTIGAGGNTYTLFSGNSTYDPDYTGVGTRAIGNAELAAFYGRFREYASRITIQAVPTVLTNGGTIEIMCYPTKDGGAPTSADLIEHSQQVNALLTTNDVTTLTHYCTTGAIHGLPNNDDLGFQHAPNANPTYRWYWVIGAVGSQNDIVKCKITIEYFVIMSDPIVLNSAVV